MFALLQLLGNFFLGNLRVRGDTTKSLCATAVTWTCISRSLHLHMFTQAFTQKCVVGVHTGNEKNNPKDSGGLAASAPTLMLSKLVANVATDVSCTTFGKSCRFQTSSTKSIRRRRMFFCQAPRPCQEAQVKLHLGSISPDTTCSKLAAWRRESFSRRQQLQK